MNGFRFASVEDGTRQVVNPSKVRDKTDFCSLVNVLNALTAVLSAGDSTVSSVKIGLC